MIEQLLESRLKPVWRRRWWLDLGWKLTACWAISALIATALLLVLRAAGWASVLTLPILILGVLIATGIVIRQHQRSKPDLKRLAREIEARDPELGGRLATALEQRPTPEAPLNFLQHRLILEAVEKSFRENWQTHVPLPRLAAIWTGLLAVIALFGILLGTLRLPVKPGTTALFVRTEEVEVTPGNAALERGSSFVVLARFGGSVPPTAELVFRPASTTPRTQSLVRSLNDPVFGGSLPEVTEDFVYHVEFNGRKSPEYKVTVFEFPRLERADAQLTFPEYTRLATKRIEDTRRITAVEGTQLDLALQLNKPVVRAQLISRNDTSVAIPLTTDPARAVASLHGFGLSAGGSYDLQLVDGDGRTNKAPAQFVFDVVSNRAPELKLLAPRGDIRPSALEEVAFDGSVWDDFGVLAYGLAFADATGEPKFIELGKDVPAQEKRSLPHTLRLEELGVAPDDLVSWFVWADDLGPDGQVRRTRGDMFFAEVRPFDEIFREGQSGEGGQPPPGGQDGSPTSKLAELQKQIINATWKLERQRPLAKKAQHAKDVVVVTESQSQALDQAKELGDGAADPRAEMMWSGVIKEMERALAQLVPATNTIVSLSTALTAETAAYRALLKLREREFQVTRNRGQQSGGGGAGEQQRQRQLEQLDFAQNENRYETQRDAQAAQTPERREELQVLSRLQELARRQEDLNERLKELQASLQAADTEKEREEIRRQLKRLQEEQQQMLADADELRQRLERPENQSRFAEQRKQLEQTRNELQRASEAASEGSTSQALAAGTRAQQQLQQMREQLQQQSSSQFADELRQMRQEARELTRQQESVAQELDALQKENRRSLSDSADRESVLKDLARQQARLTNLVEQATQVSQAAENTEPLVSRQLYDTLRQLSQDEAGGAKKMQEELIRRGQMSRSLYEQLQESAERGPGQSLNLTEQLLREGMLPQADAAEEQARQSLARLQRGVERAAESVLGDDTQALERAQQELNALADQLEREMAEATGQTPGSAQGEQPNSQSGQAQTPG
ncbi:MAG TPA: hypothetical protein DCE44_19900, partial [Verrucomicrobiales bacterium]|nr:hypothetical protein [Verrucomicrobiales bacterium]